MNSTTQASQLQLDHSTEEHRVEAARRYVQQRRVFNVHAAVFAGSMAINIAVNLFVNVSAGIADQWSAWWSIWALIGWGAGIAVHGLVVRLNRPSLTPSTWEQQQIDRVLHFPDRTTDQGRITNDN